MARQRRSCAVCVLRVEQSAAFLRRHAGSAGRRTCACVGPVLAAGRCVHGDRSKPCHQGCASHGCVRLKWRHADEDGSRDRSACVACFSGDQRRSRDWRWWQADASAQEANGGRSLRPRSGVAAAIVTATGCVRKWQLCLDMGLGQGCVLFAADLRHRPPQRQGSQASTRSGGPVHQGTQGSRTGQLQEPTWSLGVEARNCARQLVV